MKTSNRNNRAEAVIRDGRIVVSIGIETLAWACQPENGGDLNGDEGEGPATRVRLGFEDEWAQDVVHEMNREENEVDPPRFCMWIDAMCKKAWESGSVALEYPKEEKLVKRKKV